MIQSGRYDIFHYHERILYCDFQNWICHHLSSIQILKNKTILCFWKSTKYCVINYRDILAYQYFITSNKFLNPESNLVYHNWDIPMMKITNLIFISGTSWTKYFLYLVLSSSRICFFTVAESRSASFCSPSCRTLSSLGAPPCSGTSADACREIWRGRWTLGWRLARSWAAGS